MPIEITALGPALAAVGAAVKTIEFAYALDSVEEDTSDYLLILRTITCDLHEAIRLRNLPATARRMSPEALRRVDDVIAAAQDALQGVARLVENPRADVKKKGGVGVANRFLWVLRDSRNVLTKQVLLSTTHNSLLNVIGEMGRVTGGEAVGGKGREKGAAGWDDEEEGEALRRALVVRHFKRRVEEEGRVVEEEEIQYAAMGTTPSQPTYTAHHSTYSLRQPQPNLNASTPSSAFPYADHSAAYRTSNPPPASAHPPSYTESCRSHPDSTGFDKEAVTAAASPTIIYEPGLEVVPQPENTGRTLFSRTFNADRLGTYNGPGGGEMMERTRTASTVSALSADGEDEGVAQALWLARRFSSRGR